MIDPHFLSWSPKIHWTAQKIMCVLFIEPAKGNGTGPARISTDRARSWGRVIHRVLEVCAKKIPTPGDFCVKILFPKKVGHRN